jgi:hypothetical protein
VVRGWPKWLPIMSFASSYKTGNGSTILGDLNIDMSPPSRSSLVLATDSRCLN